MYTLSLALFGHEIVSLSLGHGADEQEVIEGEDYILHNSEVGIAAVVPADEYALQSADAERSRVGYVMRK